MNPYEEACERFSKAVRDYSIARAEAEAILAAADAEWEAAEKNLRAHESRPGIPLPEYREQVTA